MSGIDLVHELIKDCRIVFDTEEATRLMNDKIIVDIDWIDKRVVVIDTYGNILVDMELSDNLRLFSF